MENLNLDWYTYLTEDFKLDRSQYKSHHKAVVDCPRCGGTQVVRVNHLKAKIKKLGFYECSRCRKSDSLIRARTAFKDKHGVENPYQLPSVKEKIRNTLMNNHGVECILSKPEIHQKGIIAAKEKRDRTRKYEIDYSQISFKSSDRTNWMREYNNLRLKNDPEFAAQKMVYSALRRMLKGYKISKTSIYKEIGYSSKELRLHIESLFKPGMTWKNHGKWHLDHVIPLSKFDCTDFELVKEANQLKNLQPLWARDNLKKSNK